MLGKLMKYEIKATARTFLPLYGTVIVLGILNKIFSVFEVFDRNSAFPVELTAALAMMLYSFVICAIFVMTLIVTIQRFHKNLLGDEGYLMFTLPVKPWQHIAVKMIAAAMWFIISVFVTALSVVIIGYYRELPTDFFRGLFELIRNFQVELGFHWIGFSLETLILSFAFLMSGILMIYASMSIGHLFQKHRMMMSFASFLGISFLSQLVSGILFRIVDALCNIDNANGLHIWLNNNPVSSVHLGLFVLIIWCLIFCAAYFFLSNFVLSRRLNLE